MSHRDVHPALAPLLLGLALTASTTCLAQGPPPEATASDTLAVPGGSLFYETAGRGDTLVLVHDGLVHREIWERQWDDFARTYAVVRYDRRGYGRSPISTAPYSSADDLLALLDRLGIRRATLIGMSAGGGLVVDFTLAHPERVSAIVLVGSVVSGMLATDHMRTRGGRLTPALRGDPPRAIRYFLDEDPYELGPGVPAATRARLHELMKNNPHALAPDQQALVRPPARNARSALGEIRAPALVVVGEHDIPDVHAWAGALEVGIRGARRVVVSGAGHLVPFDQPEAFNAEVLRFLAAWPITAAIDSGRIEEAERLVTELAQRRPELKPFGEGYINGSGYAALQQGRAAEAVRLFRLYTRVYPESWNAWDSLGEAYGAAGDLDAAIAAYSRSLELNPGNPSGREALERLRRQREGARPERR